MNPEWTIAVVCTDKGQHPRNRLFRVAWWPDGTMTSGPVSANLQPPSDDIRPGEAGSRTSYVITCPRCARTPQFAAERYAAVMSGARAAGLHVLDVSRLE